MFGAQPPRPEWGSMLADGRQFLSSHWWVATMPGIAIAITVDEMPEVIWSVDNPGYLLMSRLSSILATDSTFLNRSKFSHR